MSDDQTGGTVIDFPTIAYRTPDDPAPVFTPAPDPLPPANPDETDRWTGPLAHAEMAAMASEPISVPAAANAEAAPPVTPGFIPDTFLAAPQAPDSAASVVALSIAAVIGIAVAAMRGVHTAITSRNGGEKAKKSGADGGKKGKKDIPSSREYGERALGKTSGKKSGSGSGSLSSGLSSGSGKKGSGGSSGPSSGGLSAGGKSSKRPGAGAAGAGGSGGGKSGGSSRKPGASGGKTGAPGSGSGGSSGKAGGSGGPGRRSPGKGSAPGSGRGPGGAGKPGGLLRKPGGAGGNAGSGGGPGKPGGKGSGPGSKTAPGSASPGKPPTGSGPGRPGKPGAGKAGPGSPKRKGAGKGKARHTVKKHKRRSAPDDTTLFGAIHKTARDRWNRRRDDPPVWRPSTSTGGKAKAKKKRDGRRTSGGPVGADRIAALAHLTGHCSCTPGTPLSRCAEYRAAKRAERRWTKRDRPASTSSTGDTGSPGAPPGPGAPGSSSSTGPGPAAGKAGKKERRGKGSGRRGTSAPLGDDFTAWAAGDTSGAGSRPDPGTTYEWLPRPPRRPDRPRPALATGRTTVAPPKIPHPRRRPDSPMPSSPAPTAPAATSPVPAVPAPGVTLTKARPAPATGAGPMPAGGAGLAALDSSSPDLAPEHQTEVTIDDVLAKLMEITEAGFSRHESALRLAERCRVLLGRLDAFAHELTRKNNVAGPRTHAALARLAEKVKLMLAKIEELGALSLTAAEMSEGLEHDMFTEYKPIQQETADRGLTTPSAAIHNQA